MILPSQALLSAVLNIEFIPATGKELLENSFGYAQGLRTTCIKPLKLDEWICIRNEELSFGFIDMRPEVLVNIPKGVYTDRTIDIYKFMNLCKKWVYKHEEKSINKLNSCFNDELCECTLHHYEDLEKDCFNKFFYGENEPEAVIKACEYLLNKEQK